MVMTVQPIALIVPRMVTTGPVYCSRCGRKIAEVQGQAIIVRRKSPEIYIVAMREMVITCNMRENRSSEPCKEVNHLVA